MPSLYPPSPCDVPLDLTEPTALYKKQIALVLCSVGLFFLLYFGIMAGCVLFCLWALGSILLFGRVLGPVVVLQLFLCLPALLLFVYMLKNLFRFGGREKNDYVEVFENEHPRLFDFINHVCAETGAPYPKRVFVNPDVNAAAFNDGTSFWHLFIPSEQNLLIGLGLVNAINLTEFKALLAHEFGHFSQKSTRLGVYVYTALGIINQLVEGQDGLDRFIEGWCRCEPALAFPAWIVYGVLWLLRHALMGLRYAMFGFHAGLRQQMEFNADLVAVSVTGSDAPVHLLCRSVFAQRCLEQTVHDLRAAMDHRAYTADLFYHQSHAVAYLRRRAKKPTLGAPPPLPADANETTEVFDPNDEEQADMWAMHPSNHDRERNAKAHYIRSAFDERSPWLLFDDVEQLRADVTYKFYRRHFGTKRDTPQYDAEEVQAFIDDEHAETTYDPRYQGLYDYRNLVLGDIHSLAREIQQAPWSIAQLETAHADLYNVEVKHRGQLHNKRLEEHGLLLAVSNGWHKPKNDEVDFRGELYETREARRLLKKVEKELKGDEEWFGALDRRVFATYYQMAQHLEESTAEDLFRRYRFHLDLQIIWRLLRSHEAPVNAALQFLQKQRSDQLENGVFYEALAIFRAAQRALREGLHMSLDMTIPDLKNMKPGTPLRKFLLKKPLVEGLSKYDQSIGKVWINRLLEQFREVQTKTDRIHFKSLGGILALQERIGAGCVNRWSNAPSILPVPPNSVKSTDGDPWA